MKYLQHIIYSKLSILNPRLPSTNLFGTPIHKKIKSCIELQ